MQRGKKCPKTDSCSAWGCTWRAGVALANFSCKLHLIFFHRPGVQVHPLHPRLRLWLYMYSIHWLDCFLSFCRYASMESLLPITCVPVQKKSRLSPVAFIINWIYSYLCANCQATGQQSCAFYGSTLCNSRPSASGDNEVNTFDGSWKFTRCRCLVKCSLCDSGAIWKCHDPTISIFKVAGRNSALLVGDYNAVRVCLQQIATIFIVFHLMH